MATIRKTITVTEQQSEWIKARILVGGFTNDSEYIRDLIRRDQARHDEIEWLRGELQKGEQSGEPRRFDGERFKAAMAAGHGKKAR